MPRTKAKDAVLDDIERTERMLIAELTGIERYPRKGVIDIAKQSATVVVLSRWRDAMQRLGRLVRESA